MAGTIENDYELNSNSAMAALTRVSLLSGNSKQLELKKYPGLKVYLKAAYDPYTMYYMTSKQLIHSFNGGRSGVFSADTWEMLKNLSQRNLSGADAINAAKRELARLSDDSRILLLMILDKDLRIGLAAKSINKVFKGLIPTNDVMLAKLFEEGRVRFPCYASPKIDGVRGTKRGTKILSRNGMEYLGLGHILEEINALNYELDGELTIPGLSFQKSSGLIRNDSPTPNAVFNVFDIPDLEVPFKDRLSIIKDLAALCPSVNYVPHRIVNSQDELMKYYALCRTKGYEGAVVKPIDYEYVGTRSYSWMKLKPRETVDLRVTGVYEGTGKYINMLGGVYVNYNEQSNKVGSGFSDKERSDFWEAPSMIVGKVIEVDFMEETTDGNMRHASFLGIREDKS